MPEPNKSYTCLHTTFFLINSSKAVITSSGLSIQGKWPAVDARKITRASLLHLHALRARLDVMLEREGRTDIARACFGFLPDRARLDLMGWPENDIFSHE